MTNDSPIYFDRKIFWPNTVWPNAVWPKVYLNESPFNRTPKTVWPKVYFTEKSHLAENKINQMDVWPKIFGKWSFDRKSNLKNKSNDQKDIWPKVHSTESFFRKMVTFRSNDNFQKKLSVKWIFNQTTLCAIFFGQMTFLSKVDSVKLPFSIKNRWPFGKMNFRSNSVRWNGNLVKFTFCQIYFRSNGNRSNGVRSNGVSVKWCFEQIAFRSKISVKWFFGKVIQNPNYILSILKYNIPKVSPSLP
jgi:hypothetical protein